MEATVGQQGLAWVKIPSGHAWYQPFHISAVNGGQYRLIWRGVSEHYTAAFVRDTTIDECSFQSESAAKMKSACENHYRTGEWQ